MVLFLTNRSRSFQNTSTIETGTSDFHKLIVTVLKMFYKKQKPETIQYKHYKTFNEQLLRTELDQELAKINLNNAELAEFHNEFLSVLKKHAPIKHKYIRANNSSYMTENLSWISIQQKLALARQIVAKLRQAHAHER